jgi:hypothetical protein
MTTSLDHELQNLLEQSEEPCISLYLSIDRLGLEYKQNLNQLKKMLRQAKNILTAKGLSAAEIKTFLKPALALPDDPAFWEHREDGLALFCSSKLFKFFRLPYKTEDMLMVGSHFYLKPLLPLINSNQRFYILALSQNAVRLLEATRYTVRQLTLPEAVPTSLAEATRYDETEIELQFRPGPVLASRSKQPTAVYYGHGGATEVEKENLLLYFYQIDRGLQTIFNHQEAPLVLAGVGYLLPVYRQANTYAHLLEQGIAGNPEELSAEELHNKALPLVQPYLMALESAALVNYQELAGTGLTSTDIKEIIPAAHQGRVAQLFVATNRHQWGAFDPAKTQVAMHSTVIAGDEELLNLAIIQTLLNKGVVHTMLAGSVPGEGMLAAIYRY